MTLTRFIKNYLLQVSHTLAGTRMVKQKCVAKHFEAIENLGCTSIVCVDKTGTLTENKMAVSHLWIGGLSMMEVVQDKVLGYNEHDHFNSTNRSQHQGLNVR